MYTLREISNVMQAADAVVSSARSAAADRSDPTLVVDLTAAAMEERSQGCRWQVLVAGVGVEDEKLLQAVLRLLRLKGETSAVMMEQRIANGQGVSVKGHHISADVLGEALRQWRGSNCTSTSEALSPASGCRTAANGAEGLLLNFICRGEGGGRMGATK